MDAFRSYAEFFLTLFALGAAGLAVMRFIWPRLLAVTIFFYSTGALVVFGGLALHLIFGRPPRSYRGPRR